MALAITASHNPALYNGIKVFTAGGKDADEDVTHDLESRMTRLEGGREVSMGRWLMTRPSPRV